MVSILSTLTVNFSNRINEEISLTQSSVDYLRASALAYGGINYGIALLKKEENPDFDWVGEDWAQVKELTFEEGTVKIEIEDECGKINLNYLTEKDEKRRVARIEQMLELCDAIGLEYAVVAAIIDWIDANDELTILSSVSGENEGAENDYYMELTPPYPCKNAPIDTLEEVLMIRGVEAENYYGEKGMSNFVTVYSDGKININTAKEDVLKSTIQIFSDETIDETLIASIVDYRKDNPFHDLSLLEEFLPQKTVKKMVDSKFVTVKSNFFTIESNATVGRIQKSIIAVVERKYPDIIIRFWKED